MVVSLTLLLPLVLAFTEVVKANPAEQKLRRDLFQDYHPEVRPVRHEKEAVNLTLGVHLTQLLNLDEGNQVLSLNAWMKHMWNDPALSWDPSKYGDITHISIQPKRLWLPDVMLYNRADASSGELTQVSTNIVLNSRGHCMWHAPTILKSTCKLDLAHFPFDQQECKLTFGSWTHDGGKLALELESTNQHLDHYSENSEWQLLSLKAEKREVFYACCPEPYPEIVYTVKLKRKSGFFVTNLIVPMAIIQMLTVVSFLLPAESGERVSLCTTLLLSMVIFMLLVSNTVPKTNEIVPLLGVFFSTAVIEMIIMLLVLCHTIRLYHKGLMDPPMSFWMRKYILEGLSYKFGIRKRKGSGLNSNYTQQSYNVDFTLESQSEQQSSNDEGLLIPHSPQYARMENDREGDQQLVNRGSAGSGDDVHKYFAAIKDNMNRDQAEKRVKAEWRIVAKTLDRCLLIFFVVVVSLTLLIFFA